MNLPAIKVESLGKRYALGLTHAKSIRELVNGMAARLTQRPAKSQPDNSSQDHFWALKDVSFEVQPGEVIGIIGRNGAGKSTLLKILSRITSPTEGRVTLRGRVASLLEVGTGFHPELTGRENVYLNGTILGMTKKEIDRQFDAIVDFSGVEKFIDTPVKRYSSGMTVRLGFAVAAHLDPEILIVDEVLAVGDVEFQNKCIGKMREVASCGRTVVFVSHNLAAVRQLTDQCVLLRQGKLEVIGTTTDVVNQYVYGTETNSAGRYSLLKAERALPNISGAVSMLEIRVISETDCSFVENELIIDIDIDVKKPIASLAVGITIFCDLGQALGTTFSPPIVFAADACKQTLRTEINTQWLAPGKYYLAITLGKDSMASAADHYDSVSEVVHFSITNQRIADRFRTSRWVAGWGNVIFDPLRVNATAPA